MKTSRKVSKILNRFRTIERNILNLQALEAFSSKEGDDLILKKIIKNEQSKKNLLLEIRNVLFGVKDKKLNDSLIFLKPKVFYLEGDIIKDKDNIYLWQFFLSRIEEAILGRNSSLVLEEKVGNDLLKLKAFSKMKTLIEKEVGINIESASSIGRDRDGYGLLKIFYFNIAK
ncbi:MAG: hypothetical protein KBF62_02835 [Candidatus Pacebacteria bacterium]|jgi:hypothetical protein|nr:hypothetical protein [Candidatus Paceibacterota bacterium]MBP9058549.1 hypothetical protein [Candidatus Paceibacterota bacterium]MBP9770521.1 hypothetical protein [Candidatus Paceibacterota bacterium]